MKIEANDKEVWEIFAQGYFRIPRFQRPYSWEEDEVSSFWSDVVKDENDQYFIGSMVVYQDKKPYFGIVDGQQRLTTVTLILAAIRNEFIKLEEENLARGIHQHIERPNIDNEDEFILNSETSFPYFQSHIQGFDGLGVRCSVGSEEQNLKNAFEFISKSVQGILPSPNAEKYSQLDIFLDTKRKSISKLKDLRDKVLALKLVFIQLDNQDDAHLIFETLNARGRDLTTSDLVKNHLLKKIKTNNERNDKAKIIWNGILKRFDDAGFRYGMDEFLLHYWLSEKKYTTDKKLFSNLKQYVNNSFSAEALLESLQSNADYYLEMIAPEGRWSPEHQRVRKSLEALLLFNVKQQRSIVLSLIRAYRQKKITLKMMSIILEQIEFFHYAFNAITSQRSSGSIATNYSKHAIQLVQSADHSKIQSVLTSLSRSLQRKLPSINEFTANFIELTYTSTNTKKKAIIRYSLEKLLGENSNGLTIDYDSMTIEHLIPESEIDADEKVATIGNIGNLLLVDKSTNNRELKNLSFVQKKEVLLTKGYPLDMEIINSSHWDLEKIAARAKILAHQIYNSSPLK